MVPDGDARIRAGSRPARSSPEGRRFFRVGLEDHRDELASLYAATAGAAKRKQWFPKGEFEPSSQTRNKYFRGAWNGAARLEIGFYATQGGKAQIAIQLNKLAKRTDVDRERAAWKAALGKLQQLLEK